jgi:hypothetical protein
MSVPVQPGAGFTAGNTARVLDVSAYNSGLGGRNYDVSPDGQRFLMIKDDQQQGAARINVVLNWLEELKRLVPIN